MKLYSYDSEVDEAVAGLIKSFLKNLPSEATVEDVLMSVIATPPGRDFATNVRQTVERSHMRNLLERGRGAGQFVSNGGQA